jgi:hypothetical protein
MYAVSLRRSLLGFVVVASVVGCGSDPGPAPEHTGTIDQRDESACPDPPPECPDGWTLTCGDDGQWQCASEGKNGCPSCFE